MKNLKGYKGYSLKIADDYWRGEHNREIAKYLNTEKVFQAGVGLGMLDITTVCSGDIKRNLC